MGEEIDRIRLTLGIDEHRRHIVLGPKGYPIQDPDVGAAIFEALEECGRRRLGRPIRLRRRELEHDLARMCFEIEADLLLRGVFHVSVEPYLTPEQRARR